MFSSTLRNWEQLYTFWKFGDFSLRLEIAATLIVSICTIVTISAVIHNFMHAKSINNVQYKKKSIVETGTMFLFFIFYYLLVRHKIGVINPVDIPWHTMLILVGTLTVILGCIVNISGRLYLGGNWGNQILIYQDHYLVTTGVYKLIRHPLYASLIWMFLGASLVYMNIAAFLSTTFIFLPFMYYRAKQEEELLIKSFPAYVEYRKENGMFFPLLWRKDDRT